MRPEQLLRFSKPVEFLEPQVIDGASMRPEQLLRFSIAVERHTDIYQYRLQ